MNTKTLHPNQTAHFASEFPAASKSRIEQTNYAMAYCLALVWLTGITITLMLPGSSASWTQQLVQEQLLSAMMVGGALAALPLVLTILGRGGRATPYAYAISLALTSILWVDLSSGQPAAYLAFIPFFALISLYDNPKLLMAGSTVLIAHHALSLFYPPFAPANFSVAVAEGHALIVLATLAVLSIAIRRHASKAAAEGARKAILPAATQTETTSVEKEPKFRVLLVDDCPVNIDSARRILERLDCSVQLATNGQEAVEAVAKAHFDAVFMDCAMPVMDGYTATTTIRQVERGSRHTWIIALTAQGEEGDREICLVVGMDDYLRKPARESDLKEALERSPRGRALGPVRSVRSPAWGKLIRVEATIDPRSPVEVPVFVSSKIESEKNLARLS